MLEIADRCCNGPAIVCWWWYCHNECVLSQRAITGRFCYNSSHSYNAVVTALWEINNHIQHRLFSSFSPSLPPPLSPVLITIYRFLYIFSSCKVKLSLSVNYVTGSSTGLLDLQSINARVKSRPPRRRRMRNMNKSRWKGRRREMVCSLIELFFCLHFTATSDAARAARIQPRRVRPWEDPKLQGKPPGKNLAPKTGELQLIYMSESK